MSGATEEVPSLVPARMVNAFCYCPRLFFLEWVDRKWDDNEDTAAGDFVHRRVDRPSGTLATDDVADRTTVARSIHLGSSELGLTAVIDIVEGRDGEVWPVDYKRGPPPPEPEGVWDSDRVQLCVQALLLRSNGYRCTRGIVYYDTTRTRAEVAIDDELAEATLALVAELRDVAARDIPPPPLIASRKCPRCSLVGICLPDETNLLLERSGEPIRQLVPRDRAARPLYVTLQGSTVGIAGGRLEIRDHGEVLDALRLIDVSQVCVYGNVQITTQAVRELMRRETPILYFSYGGWFSGITEGLPSKNVELRRRQVVVAGQGGLDVARQMIKGKIRNSRTFLRRNTRTELGAILDSLRDLAADAADAASVATLLGIEGAAARLYFGAFPTMLRREVPFDFHGRNRRPPRDQVNCLLSFTYGLLAKDLTATLVGVGFDPYLGLYHRPRFGRPAMALDLAEEFRPIVADSVVVNLLNNGEIRAHHFLERAGGVALTADGRKAVIAAYERRLEQTVRHPTFGYSATYRRSFEIQARILAAHLVGELPAYKALTTR